MACCGNRFNRKFLLAINAKIDQLISNLNLDWQEFHLLQGTQYLGGAPSTLTHFGDSFVGLRSEWVNLITPGIPPGVLPAITPLSDRGGVVRLEVGSNQGSASISTLDASFNPVLGGNIATMTDFYASARIRIPSAIPDGGSGGSVVLLALEESVEGFDIEYSPSTHGNQNLFLSWFGPISNGSFDLGFNVVGADFHDFVMRRVGGGPVELLLDNSSLGTFNDPGFGNSNAVNIGPFFGVGSGIGVLDIDEALFVGHVA